MCTRNIISNDFGVKISSKVWPTTITIISIVGLWLQAKSPIKLQENTFKTFDAFQRTKFLVFNTMCESIMRTHSRYCLQGFFVERSSIVWPTVFTIISVAILLQGKTPISIEENTFKNFNASQRERVYGVKYCLSINSVYPHHCLPSF